MNKVQKNRMIIIVLIISGVVGAVALWLYALRSNLNHFYTPSELIAGGVEPGRSIRVGGMVETGSVKRAGDDSLAVTFKVSDGAAVIGVFYEGILPDLFREGQGIVVTGVFENNRVTATEVLAKHDENYMPPEAMEAMKRAGQPVETPAKPNSYGGASQSD